MHNWSIMGDAAGSAGGAGITVLDLTLTANTNITSPIGTLTPGMSLMVIVRQNGTGGWTVTWDSIFRFPPTGFGTLANTISTTLFVSQTDPVDSVVRWWPTGQPMTNKL